MPDPDPKPPLRAPGAGDEISRNEIFEVLADEGYSAEGRKAWLKDVLTRLTEGGGRPDDPDHARLVEEIRAILHGQVSDNPEADDTL